METHRALPGGEGLGILALGGVAEPRVVVIDPESVDELAAAIARVLSDAAPARELGGRGLERSRRPSWAETARQTLAVYRDAVSG